MDLIEPCVKTYAWGSRYVIADLQGRTAPAQGPEAELWMGSHPAGPARIQRNGTPRTLDAVIADDPARELGPELAGRFGGRLPFLLKVLAAERALSIQVHPGRAQAQAGFAAEEAAGIARSDPARSYVDDWPKPEVLCALTEFEVLAGFREAGDAARLLRALQVPALDPIIAELEAGQESCRVKALEHLLGLPRLEAVALSARTAIAAERLASDDTEDGRSYQAVVRMSRDYPGDPGAVASLLLQHRTLAPGQGLYMPAAGPHAYLRGAGIEVMANSDNVLRAGLTSKHINVPELLRVIDPTVEVPVLDPEPDADGIRTYAAPVPEFCLYSVMLDERPVTVPGSGPRVLLVTSGAALVDGGGRQLRLERGQSGFIAADGLDYVFCAQEPDTTVFVASPGSDGPGQ